MQEPLKYPSYNDVKALNDALAVDERMPWAVNHFNCAQRRECAIGILLHEKGIDPRLLGRISVIPEKNKLLRYYSNEELSTVGHEPDGWIEYSERMRPLPWRFHTAMTIDTYNEHHDKVVTLVLDPGMNPLRPMTTTEWTNNLTRRALAADAANLMCVVTGKLGEKLKRDDMEVVAGPDCGQDLRRFREILFLQLQDLQAQAAPTPHMQLVSKGVVPLAHDWIRPAGQGQMQLADDPLRKAALIELETNLKYDFSGMPYEAVARVQQAGLVGQGYVDAFRRFEEQSNTPMI